MSSDPIDHRRIEELFLAALELPPEAWAAHLGQRHLATTLTLAR